jgi:hypothetical protein
MDITPEEEYVLDWHEIPLAELTLPTHLSGSGSAPLS